MTRGQLYNRSREVRLWNRNRFNDRQWKARAVQIYNMRQEGCELQEIAEKLQIAYTTIVAKLSKLKKYRNEYLLADLSTTGFPEDFYNHWFGDIDLIARLRAGGEDVP